MFGIPRVRGFLKGIYGFPMNSSSVYMYGGQKAYSSVVCGNSRLVMGTEEILAMMVGLDHGRMNYVISTKWR